jgi:hypothetical protein
MQFFNSAKALLWLGPHSLLGQTPHSIFPLPFSSLKNGKLLSTYFEMNLFVGAESSPDTN